MDSDQLKNEQTHQNAGQATGKRHTAKEQLGHSVKTTEHRAQKRSDLDRARAGTAGCSPRGASL